MKMITSILKNIFKRNQKSYILTDSTFYDNYKSISNLNQINEIDKNIIKAINNDYLVLVIFFEKGDISFFDSYIKKIDVNKEKIAFSNRKKLPFNNIVSVEVFN